MSVQFGSVKEHSHHTKGPFTLHVETEPRCCFLWTFGTKKHVLNGGPHPPSEGQFERLIILPAFQLVASC